jgi:large subunit ribosomal protein L10
MNRDQKAAVVDEVATQIQESEAVFAVDYRGISVPQAAELRVKLNEAGARFRVVKNTLTELAADRAGADPLKEVLDGPTAFTFVAADGGDVALAAKALAQFRRETELLEFKGGVMNGEALTAEQIGAIARLPAKELLHAQLVGVIASPITGLVRGLNALIAGLAIQLQQIAEQGLVGGDAAEDTSEGTSDSTSEGTSDDASDAPADESGDASGESADASGESADASGESADASGESADGSGESADDPAEADQAAQAEEAEEEAAQSAEGEEAEEEAAQSAEGEETESSSEESAPAGDEAAGDEAAADEASADDASADDASEEAAAPDDASATGESGGDQNETPSEGDEKE